jgi:hypothetical protein
MPPIRAALCPIVTETDTEDRKDILSTAGIYRQTTGIYRYLEVSIRRI